MKIDEVIRKCLEIPGISLKQGEFSSEMILNSKDGKGSMKFFPLFPGITLAYIFVNSNTWPAPKLAEADETLKGPLIINYCISGRCELILDNENYVYLTENQFSLTEHFAQNQYIYPRRIYEGLELFIDLESATGNDSCISKDFALGLNDLPDIYCPNGKTYLSEGNDALEHIFKQLWDLSAKEDNYSILRMKLFVLSLFGLLIHENNIPAPHSYTFYTESQVEIAKKVEKILTADLRQHHPAWELADTFSISETSLKNYFRGVFGQNISLYLRDVRMNRAANLLLSTKLSVAEIAEQVGYSNQSKFASVFKKKFGVAPLEYRRLKRLE